MSISLEDFQALESLVRSPKRHVERQCQKYMHHAAGLLLPLSPISAHTIQEEPSYFGRSDIIVAADVADELGEVSRVAYIWELKSPQSHLFEKDDNKQRCRPTAAYLKAENQLIHYAHLAMTDPNFRERLNIVRQSNIRMGGIVIGTLDRLLKGSTGVLDDNKARTALELRKDYFYRSQGIKILTWDAVLRFLRPEDESA